MLHSKYVTINRFKTINQLTMHYVDSENTLEIEKTHDSEKEQSIDGTPYSGKETLIFLHGFPQYSGVWDNQLNYFKSKYRVIAPDLPGYNLSDKPDNSAFYQISNLITVIADFIRAVTNQPVYLVAHDWGGALAWPLTAFRPDLIKKLIILNAAHPSTFTREILNNKKQQIKSRYINDLISETGQLLISQNNFQYLQDLIKAESEQLPFNEQEFQKHIQSWSQPNAIKSMLQYYRNMPLHEDSNEARKIPNIQIKRPTLVLWGLNDSAFCPEILNGLEQYVRQLKIVQFKHATHWLHHEIPDAINKEIAEFIVGHYPKN